MQSLAVSSPESDSSSQARTWKGVYTIIERNGKKFWLRIGIAFPNKDSMRVLLDANPRNGELVIKAPLESELRRRPTSDFPELPPAFGGGDQ